MQRTAPTERCRVLRMCAAVQLVQQAMEAEYNSSQMTAVTAGLDRSPVILIQASSHGFPMRQPPDCCTSARQRLHAERLALVSRASLCL